MLSYHDHIAKRRFVSMDAGFEPIGLGEYRLFDFQRDIVRWACNRGKAAVFADTGLGKTFMQLAWADQVTRQTGRPVIVLAPLAVAEQTIREGAKFGIDVERLKSDVFGQGVYITNYEQLHNFDCSQFSGVVLDESSILKGMNGKLRKQITSEFSHTPYKLSCTATPSPNDYMELGTQSEFLGLMSQVEMLAMFFIHDGADTSKWRLKGHGKTKFWEWLSTWAVFINNPADLGYSDADYTLPELVYHEYIIDGGMTDGLLPWIAQSLSERGEARRNTIDQRVAKASEIANQHDTCLIWCNMNEESEKLTAAIAGAVEVTGSMKPEQKRDALVGFTDQTISKLVSKPRIAGFGMNWQHCNHIVFTGLSDSWEQFYQAIRRCWRFGQTKPVHVHIVSADCEGAVVANIKRKDQQHKEMSEKMMAVTKSLTMAQLGKAKREDSNYIPTEPMEIPAWIKS